MSDSHQSSPGAGQSAKSLRPPSSSPGGASKSNDAAGPGGGAGQQGQFRLNINDALTPDPGTEDMFRVDDNKFAFSPGQLSKLLDPKSLDAFYTLGGLSGLERGLRTDRNAGLNADENELGSDARVRFEDVAARGAPKYGANGNDELAATGEDDRSPSPPPKVPQQRGFADRRRVFGTNRLPEKKPKSLLQLIWLAYNDKVLILLTIAAIVSLALGLYEAIGVEHGKGEARVEWIEGVAIMVAIIIVVMVSALNDYQMERQFLKLNEKHDDHKVKVIRSGKPSEVSVFDIVVGDIMHLNTGDLVPVDGIFIQGHGVNCDESSVTGESDLIKKVPADDVYAALQKVESGGEGVPGNMDKLDPFIISGSKVNEGTGTFLVTGVGAYSSYGRITMAMQTEQEETPLQKKLNALADRIAAFGCGAALILFVVLFIKFLVQLPHNHSTPAEKGNQFMRLFITAVTVVVVAVPEGLPLAVTLALAFATTRMMKDQNLVRVLRACETMGGATTICSDKTGTLTQNKMTVVAATLGKSISFGGTAPPLDEEDGSGGSIDIASATGSVPAGEFVRGIGDGLKKLLVQSNAVNSTAFEGDVDGEKSFIGSKTEVALLTFCRDRFGAPPVEEERHNSDVVQQVPFDSSVKYMTTVVKLPDGKFRAYVKGASEILLSKCTRLVAEPDAQDFSTAELTGEDRDMFTQLITSYASQTLRTIGSSYRDFDSWPPHELSGKTELTAADFDKVHEGMTLVAIFGIKDPVRDAVPKAIKDCQRAGVVVRMVTGDNIITGRSIAKECGIYTPKEGGIAMEGPAFRRKSEEELKEVVPKLQVLARSSPEDKRILVKTLKELGETVAVTGDGTNDAPALKLADIGFAMGQAGTEVAKEAAAIIIMDDNFASIVKGISWGRAVNDSVKKFLQFQLTVNVTAVVLTFVSAVTSGKGESVLNAVQLLWINLIMDTFAALALATDPPSPSVLDRKPEGKSAPLVNLRMFKQIIGQAICQFSITLVLNFAGESLLGYDDTDRGSMRLKTVVFNTFVWLQIFNELNNRRLDNRLNILEGITKNWLYIIINIIIVGGQVLIIFVGGQAFKITRLDGKEWGLSIGLGALSIPWGVLIRLFPDRWIAAALPWMTRKRWAPETIDEDMEANRKAKAEDSRVKPLRTMSMVRGQRAMVHMRRGFREYIHDQKVKVTNKASKVYNMASSAAESTTEVLLPTSSRATDGSR